MKFNEILIKYINVLNCSSKELSKMSGLSQAVISRYKSGQRVPSAENAERLVKGFQILSIEKNITIDPKVMRDELLSAISTEDFNSEKLADNLNFLMNLFDINANELAKAINYDPSYLSRIRSKQRKPQNPAQFSQRAAAYFIKHCDLNDELKALKSLVGSDRPLIDSLVNWLYTSQIEQKDYVSDFLDNMDNFNLDEFIRNMQFNDINISDMPLSIPAYKIYLGEEQMYQGELDFLKATIISDSYEDVFMHNDFPIVQRANDYEYSKQWMYAIAVMLNKGLHLNMVHELNRPFEELMMGLKIWIPIYMTGRVSPYYLPHSGSTVYHHVSYVSGAAALSGECIGTQINNGRSVLTKKVQDLKFFKTKAEDILSYATPLMNIYRSENADEFAVLMKKNSHADGERRIINSSLPCFTLTKELLFEIANRNGLSQEEIKKIEKYIVCESENMSVLLKTCTVTEEINELTKEQFADSPLSLSLSGAFINRTVTYSYDEYLRHLQLTLKYAEHNPAYFIKKNSRNSFKNISITIQKGKWVLISKDKTPTVHFMIHHPKLVKAIENYNPYLTD